MSWDDLNKDLDPEKLAEAKKDRENREQAAKDLSSAYARLFKTPDGQTVLSDLTGRFVYDNGTDLASPNINYEAAFHNGEGGAVKYIIHQSTKVV